MRTLGRWVGLVALAVVALALLGCGEPAEPTLTVSTWRLTTPDHPEPTTVTLPAHLEAQLPSRRSTYQLRAEVELPADLRGKDLVLCLDRLRGRADLLVDGRAAPPVLGDLDPEARPPPHHAWRVRAEHTREGRVTLELRVLHASAASAWVDAAPRLSATPAGDATWRRTALLHSLGATSALGALLTMAITHFSVWLFDRRRVQNAWFTVQALCAAYYPLFQTGESLRLAGSFDTSALGLAVGVAAIAGVCFTYAAFELGRPPRALAFAAAILVAAALVFRDPFRQRETLAPIVLAVVGGVVVFHVTTLARIVQRRPRPPNAIAMLVGWSIVFGVVLLDGATFAGKSGLFRGNRVGSWGLVLAVLAQALALGRILVRSLARADDLNLELADRVRLLESRKVEIETLNGELRRQIGARSRQMVEALARTVGAGGGVSVGPGDVIDGRWRVVRLLGVGGVGRVFEVERVEDGRRAALKVLAVANELATTRFAREAELVAQVDSPYVVGVLDVGVAEEGFLYIVLELVTGASLADARARFGDVAWAREVVAQVAGGLAAIHARGIVHRDLKPQNVLLAEGDPPRAKITDFGVSGPAARHDPSAEAPTLIEGEATGAVSGVAEGEPPGAGSSIYEGDLTATGVVLGTPRFMAPELADGARDATAASDVFGLGVMAYELLSGSPPFAEAPAVARLRGRPLPEPPRPLAIACPAVPATLAALVDAAMSYDPSARPTAAEVATAARSV